MRFLRHTAAIATAVVAVMVGTTSPMASAADEPAPPKGSWSVQPGGTGGGQARSSFVYTMRPGTVLRDVVRVANTGRRPVTLDLYPADAYLTGEEGAFAVRNRDEPRTNVSRWVRLGGKKRHTIRPGKGLEIPFELRVPRNAEPGDHTGALIAAGTRIEDGGGEGPLGFDVRRRVGARIYLRVEGPLDPQLAVASFSATGDPDVMPLVGGDGRTTVAYEITNPGNIRIAPEARLELRGPFGNLVSSQPVELPELLPGSTITRTATFDSLPAWGRLTAELVVTSEEVSTSASAAVWSVPWAPALVVVLLLGAWWLRRRRRHGRPLLPGRPRRDPTGLDSAAEAPEREPAPAPVARIAAVGTALALPLVLGIGALAPASADSPSVLVGERRTEVGAVLQVSGRGWSEGDLLTVALCGRGGATSTDCATASSREVGVGSDGGFAVPLTMLPPPRACPCAVVVSGTGGMRVAAPIRLAGHPRRPLPDPKAADVTVEAALEDTGGFATWFGAPARPVLALRLRNDGAATARPRLDLGWSAGPGAARVIPPPDLGRLAPGEEVTVRVPVSFDPLGHGTHEVAGTMFVDGTEESFTVTTGVNPWGLYLGTALLVGGGLLLGWRRVTTRRHPEQIPQRRSVEQYQTADHHQTEDQPDDVPGRDVPLDSMLV